MIKIRRTTILKEDVDRFLHSSLLNNILQEENLSIDGACELFVAISEKAEWDIYSILSTTIQEIENERVRCFFRRFLISEMYNILMNYPRGGTKEYCIVYADDKCILVQSPHIIRNDIMVKPASTIVLSPKGEILVPEDKVYIYENSITAHGFTSKWNDLYGLYTRDGELFLPCIFEYVSNKYYERYLYLRYKGIYYWLQYWADPLTISAEYQYKDIVFTIYPEERLPSFLPETNKYQLPIEELESEMAENSKELFDILDTYFHRLSQEELEEIEKNK